MDHVSAHNLPSLFRRADGHSTAAQRWATVLLRVNLIAILAAALLASFTLETQYQPWLMALVAAAFVVAATTTIISLIQRPERLWHSNRAVAESVKSMAWKYMTGAPPFELTKPPPSVDSVFRDELNVLLGSLRPFGAIDDNDHGEQITTTMRAVRATPYNDRLTTYIRDRVRDQHKWYHHKARYNASRSTAWLIAIIVSQLLAVLAAVSLVFVSDAKWNPSGFAAALAASLGAWLQFRRHQELEQSYAIAEQDLSLIVVLDQHVSGDASLAEFVTDAETAMSREHTAWLARREHL